MSELISGSSVIAVVTTSILLGISTFLKHAHKQAPTNASIAQIIPTTAIVPQSEQKHQEELDSDTELSSPLVEPHTIDHIASQIEQAFEQLATLAQRVLGSPSPEPLTALVTARKLFHQQTKLLQSLLKAVEQGVYVPSARIRAARASLKDSRRALRKAEWVMLERHEALEQGRILDFRWLGADFRKRQAPRLISEARRVGPVLVLGLPALPGAVRGGEKWQVLPVE
eukprot:gnl/Dysnectes_brevis/238_a269_3410.p1 GENE.gnl/Dysnectes_brevis/238_a269_3410~~gnl/Dysnectes_brevis/238_a269_3410.p1  ORF type:complete len:227 (-),score=72.50 gnl/Dysnectes_brevis/238_a269_3410:127-807(-)